MLRVVQDLLAHQFEAAFCTLNLCLDKCPETAWTAPVANLKFCQVAFHTLFFADYYLGRNEELFRRQPYHVANQDVFRDYEEFASRVQTYLYDKPFIEKYHAHCREKAAEVIVSETEATLAAPLGFSRRATLSRAETHVYNIRHVQHHAAQLSLRLRLDHGVEIHWVGSGWREA